MTNKQKFLSLVSDEKPDTVQKNSERVANRMKIRKKRICETYSDKTILFANKYETIGQVKIEQAQQEVDRLNKNSINTNWRMDASEMMCILDSDYCTAIELDNGYVWVTCASK